MKAILVLALVAAVYAGNAYFFHVTDNHYQEDYKKGGDPDNKCHGSGGSAGKFGDYNCNTPWRSVKALTNQIMNKSDTLGIMPDFVLFTGDFMSSRDADESEKAFKARMTNWTALLKKVQTHFGGKTKIFPLLGNHDAAPKQFEFPADSNYLSYTEEYNQWKDFLSADAQATLKIGGYYTELIRTGLRFIGLNTAMYYKSNDSIKVDKNTDPLGQFAWFAKVLADARAAGEKVFIGSHISPGLSTTGTGYPMHKVWSEKLLETMNGYHKDVIIAGFYGHIHADLFRILKDTDGGSGASIAFLAGSGTARSKVNPTVTMFKYDTATPFTLKEKVVYYYNLETANKEGAITWKTLYHAAEKYNVTDVSTASMKEVYKKLKTYDSDEWKAFFKYAYAKASGHSCDSAKHKKMLCAIKNAYGADADACAKL